METPIDTVNFEVPEERLPVNTRNELIKLLQLIDSTDFDSAQLKIQMKLEVIRAIMQKEEMGL